ncbi:MAG: RING-HC finger protein [Cetobacterium sp.]
MDLNIETKRLETFNNWNVSFIDKNQLALFGFYYYGPGDMVKCYFCHVEIGMWEEGDDVLTDHIRWSESCKLICRDTTNNIPINETLLLESLPPAPLEESRRTLSSGDDDVRRSIDRLNLEEWVNPFTNNWNFSDKMDNFKYAIETDRLKSYKDWPISMKQKPHQLSDAGFYYTGIGDKVCCYYCGGGLKDWEEEDDPWENHAMWYGKCKYVKTVKGDDFIKKMKERRELLLLNKNSSDDNKKKDEKNNIINNDEEDDTIGKCKICFENDYNTVFIPCGHIISCAKCSLSVTKCPACRQPFERVINVYYSS